jgi:hypothetical protein
LITISYDQNKTYRYKGAGAIKKCIACKSKPKPFWKVLAVVGACWIAKELRPGMIDAVRTSFVQNFKPLDEKGGNLCFETHIILRSPSGMWRSKTVI